MYTLFMIIAIAIAIDIVLNDASSITRIVKSFTGKTDPVELDTIYTSINNIISDLDELRDSYKEEKQNDDDEYELDCINQKIADRQRVLSELLKNIKE